MSHFHKHLRYDPTATSVNNQIIAEKNYLLDGNIIRPKYDTYFFSTNHQIKGFNNSYPAGLVLIQGTDYNLVVTSTDYSEIIGEDVYSHAVLTNLTFDTVEFTYQALGSDIWYDATGVVPENFIQNERFNIGSIFRVKPYNHTYFFAAGLVVKGHTLASPAGIVLVNGVDYILSPIVQPFTDSIGVDIHNYFDLQVNVYEWVTFSYHALGNFLPYDPTGTESSNLITDEMHYPITSVCITPLANSAFTKGSFVAKGYNGTYPTGLILKEINDYFFSPMYLTYSADMAKEIYSYIVLTQPGVWDSVEITYQATGGSIDATLFAEISAAGAFDKNDPLQWMNFKGQTNTLNIGYFYDSEPDQSFLRILNIKLNEIKVAIENLPAAPNIQLPDYITIAFNDIIAQLNNQQSFFNNAIGDLSTYGSLTTRTKIINDPAYTVVHADLGFTLIFTNATGCVLTIPNTLPANMWFKVLQSTGAGQVTWAANTPATTFFNSGATYLTTKDPGDLCTFLKVATDKYLTTSSRVESDPTSSYVIVNSDTLLIDANAHNGKTLIFTYASGDVTVTIPDTLPNGMRWKEYKASVANAVNHTPAGTATLISTNGIKSMDRCGDSLEFIKLEDGVPTFTISGNRDSLSGINRIKVIASNNYAITNVDNGYTLLFTNVTNGAITISDDLVKDFACQIYKTAISATAVFSITHSGTVTKEGSYNNLGLTKIGELIDIRQYEPNKYILNTNQKDLPNNIVTTTMLSAALAGLTNKPVRVRQTVMSGEVNSEGHADWLYIPISSTDVKCKTSLDKSLTFGDGHDETGERNYVVKIPSGVEYTWSAVVGADQTAANCKFLYIDLDPSTGNITTGSHPFLYLGNPMAPIYSANEPVSGITGQFWYPTDHRHRGKVWDGANWSNLPDNKLRLYVAFVDTNVYPFYYNGKALVYHTWNNIDNDGPNHNVIPFNGDNCQYDTELYMEVQTTANSLAGAGYEVGEVIKAPMIHYDGGYLHGFNIVRKPNGYIETDQVTILNGIARYKGYHILQAETANVNINKTWLVNRTSTNPLLVNLSDFKLVLDVNRSF